MHLSPLITTSLASTAFAHLPPQHTKATPANCAARTTTHISSTLLNTTSSVDWTYNTTNPLDGPKVHPVNGSTFDWWYFDAVSSNLSANDLSSVVLTFYTASPTGFAALANTSTVLQASITGTLADGTPFEYDEFPAAATVVTEGDGSAGVWGEEGDVGWSSSPSLRHWTVEFHSPSNNVSGSMSLESLAPPHLPCGPIAVGGTEQLMPHIGWANTVPDALATVNFSLNGTELAFTVPGYHDKNWGDQPFFQSVGSWYWGHGRLGPYSIVWFDALDYGGTEYFSSYVAKDGVILSASCVANASVLVRPWGGEDGYPPPATDAVPEGFVVTYADVEGGALVVNVTTATAAVADGYVYDRWIGTVAGGFTDGRGNWTGVAQYEEFKV